MPGKHKGSHISSEAIFAIPSMGAGKAFLAITLCCLLIFLDFNLNLSKKSFWKKGLNVIESFINELETL